jgi:hypothetical protein
VLVPFAFAGSRTRRMTVVAIGAAVYVAVWASPLGSFQLRFLTPVLPLAAVLAAAGADAVSRHTRRVHRWLPLAPTAAVTALLALNLPPFVDWHETERRGWDGWLTHVLRALPAAVVVGAESESHFLTRTVPSYAAWEAIDARAPNGSRVLTFVGGDHIYSRRARLWSDATEARAATWDAEAGQLGAALEACRRLGITHVLFDKRQYDDPGFARLALASPQARACCLDPFYEDGRIVVYGVSYPDAAPAGSTAASR